MFSIFMFNPHIDVQMMIAVEKYIVLVENFQITRSSN